MQEEFNHNLCIKFATEVIEMVTRFKENRHENQSLCQDALHDHSLQYGIPMSVLKSFFKVCREPLQIYIPLSVGQYYHFGGHAASQIACLENLREGVEHWLRQQAPTNLVLDRQVLHKTFYWPITFIAADSLQTLNESFPIDLDINKFQQCMGLLLNANLEAREDHYYQMGLSIIQFYRSLFKINRTQREEGVNIRFQFKGKSLHWVELKKEYQDPQFVEMVNYLEACFKYAIKLILASSDMVKLKTKLQQTNWQDTLKLNDLSYIIAEIVMVNFKLLTTGNMGETKQNILFYPGPLDVLLGTGKNLMAYRFPHLIKQQPCLFLRSMQNLSNGHEVELAKLFSGKIQENWGRLVPDNELALRRKKCIQDILKEEGAQQVLLMFLQRHAVEVKRQTERKLEKFALSPHRRFLDELETHCAEFKEVIVKLESDSKIVWQADAPLACLRNFCGNFHDECADQDEFFLITTVKNLQDYLRELEDKFNSKPKYRQEYLKRCAGYLVGCVINIANHYGTLYPQQKRSKLTSSAETQSTTTPAQIFNASLCYFIQNIIESGLISLNELMDPDYFPDMTPQVEYRLTQDSLNNSATDLNNSSQSLIV